MNRIKLTFLFLSLLTVFYSCSSDDIEEEEEDTSIGYAFDEIVTYTEAEFLEAVADNYYVKSNTNYFIFVNGERRVYHVEVVGDYFHDPIQIKFVDGQLRTRYEYEHMFYDMQGFCDTVDQMELFEDKYYRYKLLMQSDFEYDPTTAILSTSNHILVAGEGTYENVYVQSASPDSIVLFIQYNGLTNTGDGYMCKYKSKDLESEECDTIVDSYEAAKLCVEWLCDGLK